MKRIRKEDVITIPLNRDLWDIILWESNPIRKKLEENLLSNEDKIELLKYIVFFQRISKSFTMLFNEIIEAWYRPIFCAIFNGKYYFKLKEINIFEKKIKYPNVTHEIAKKYVKNEIAIMKACYLKDKKEIHELK